jgi:hypothetical protein
LVSNDNRVLKRQLCVQKANAQDVVDPSAGREKREVRNGVRGQNQVKGRVESEPIARNQNRRMRQKEGRLDSCMDRIPRNCFVVIVCHQRVDGHVQIHPFHVPEAVHRLGRDLEYASPIGLLQSVVSVD